MSSYTFKEKSDLKKSGWNTFDKLAENVFDKSTELLVDSVENWAGKTYRDFVNYTPVDTGNLQESIDIYEDEMPYAIAVGVNETELKGPKTLRSKTYLTAKRGLGQTRHIPNRNYVLDSDNKGTPLELRVRNPDLKFFVSQIWKAYAKMNGIKYFK